MLTIQNNLKNTNLETLSKRLIKDDYHNFRLSVVGGGFTEGIADRIISKLTSNEDAKIVVINDVTLQMICKLLEAGYKLENITLAFGKWNSNGTVSKDKAVYTIMNSFIKANVKETIKTINLEELFSMKFDLIIANPPYSTIGAKITNGIKTNVEYKQFINLLPANDYKRVTGLHQHVRNMESINNGFEDAAVTTHLCEVVKESNNLSIEEFEIAQYIDPSLNKYFYKNRTMLHYAIDAGITWLVFAEANDVTKTVLLDHRCIPHKHLAYSKGTDEYKWNVLESINNNSLANSSKSLSTPGKMNKYVVKLNTVNEKQNMVNFIYSNNGFRFISKLFKALNTDSTLELCKWFPKVDWTRSWTVEEILADYSYTDAEIAEVMSDLENFKGMED